MPPPKVKPVLPSLSDQRSMVNVLYYGKQGSAKTTNMAGGSREGPMIFVDAESGLKKQALKQRGVKVDNIQVHDKIEYDALDGLFWDVKSTLEADPDSVYAVALDSVTELQKLLLEQIVSKAVDKAAKRGMDRDPFFIDRPDWGVVTEQSRRLTRRFRDLPCHVAFGALEKRDTDPDGAVVYSPALTPAYQTDLMGYVDIIIHTDVIELGGEVFYIGTSSPVGKYVGKDRFSALPPVLIDPTLDRVVAYVNGEIDPETDPRQVAAREAKARDTPKTGT